MAKDVSIHTEHSGSSPVLAPLPSLNHLDVSITCIKEKPRYDDYFTLKLSSTSGSGFSFVKSLGMQIVKKGQKFGSSTAPKDIKI